MADRVVRLQQKVTVMWTQFMDMHSGGGQKLEWQYIYIEAPEAEAAVIFQNLFGRNPHRVTCTCCGDDYSLSESETLEDATGFERGCASAYFDAEGKRYSDDDWYKLPIEKRRDLQHRYVEEHGGSKSYRPYRTLQDYLENSKIKIIRASEITPSQRQGELQEEGYVWRE